jgi:hypothetical protein
MSVEILGSKGIPDPQPLTAQPRLCSHRAHAAAKKCRDAMKRAVPVLPIRLSVRTRHTTLRSRSGHRR